MNILQQMPTNQRSKYTLDDILEKEQYKIKLNIRYYFFSGTNAVAFAIVYLTTSSTMAFCVGYLIAAMCGYKFVFSLTKDGKQYQPFFVKKAALLMKTIRNKNLLVKDKK